MFSGMIFGAFETLSHNADALNFKWDDFNENVLSGLPEELSVAKSSETLPDKDIKNLNLMFNIDEIKPLLKTEPNTAFFWSGKTDGLGGADVAQKIAIENGGVTLESTIQSQNIEMPEWSFDDTDSLEAWDLVSAAYAEQVSGEIKAVIGSKLREGNIWENIELPKLKSNLNVTKITIIDPKTKVEKIIFERI